MKNILVALLVLIISPAWAQEAIIAPPAPASSDAPVAMPSVTSPATNGTAPAQPAPAAETVPTTLQPNAGNFPPLPPSRPCARPDADGLWKLKNVFENPRGPTTADFANNPHQYLLFLRDDTYRTYKEVWGEKTPDQVRTELETALPVNLQQFVIHESGMIFFYVDGTNIDSQACFIVATQKGAYLPGQMILMPPEGRIATRLAMVYERILKPSEMKSSNEVQPNPPRRPRRLPR